MTVEEFEELKEKIERHNEKAIAAKKERELIVSQLKELGVDDVDEVDDYLEELSEKRKNLKEEIEKLREEIEEVLDGEE